jgi:hypothetical protein
MRCVARAFIEEAMENFMVQANGLALAGVKAAVPASSP